MDRAFDLHFLPGKCYTLLGVVTEFLSFSHDPAGERFRRRGVFCTILKLATGDRRGEDGKLDFGTRERIFAGISPVCVTSGCRQKLSENERMKRTLFCYCKYTTCQKAKTYLDVRDATG